MDPNFAKNLRRQRVSDPNRDRRVLLRDESHGFRRTHQTGLFIEPHAAMSIRMREPRARDGPSGRAHQVLGGAHVLNSGMSGFEPQQQKEVDLNGNFRGW